MSVSRMPWYRGFKKHRKEVEFASIIKLISALGRHSLDINYEHKLNTEVDTNCCDIFFLQGAGIGVIKMNISIEINQGRTVNHDVNVHVIENDYVIYYGVRFKKGDLLYNTAMYFLTDNIKNELDKLILSLY